MGIDKVNGVVEVYILNKIEEAKKTGELNLSFCNLVSLPESLFELTNLQTLNLQHNYFTILPKRLKELAGLTKLNFELNQLEDLPPEIGELTNLKKLNLKNNQLTTLPPEIGLLTNLTELDLSSNQLTTLPIEIALLTDLQNLYLQGNPLQIPPLEIADLGMAAIIDYFKNSTKAALLEKPEFDWNYDRNLHFEYQYKQTARVIMTCFIDRQRRPNRIENLLFWKDGVVLFYEDTKALVELDPGQLKIIVLIDGPKRKELLGIIRKDFHNIHSSLNVIEVKEMIPCVCNACAQEPQLFSFKTLKQSFANGQYKTLCAKSGAEVSIAEILGEIEDQTGQEPVDLFDGWRPIIWGKRNLSFKKMRWSCFRASIPVRDTIPNN